MDLKSSMKNKLPCVVAFVFCFAAAASVCAAAEGMWRRGSKRKIPCEPKTRAEIPRARVIECVGESQSRVLQPVGTELKIRQASARFIRRGEVFVTQPEVDRERRRHLPVVLDEARVYGVPEIPLRRRGRARVGVGIDGLKHGCIVSKVEQTCERVIGTRAAGQIVVILLAPHFRSKPKRVLAAHPIQGVAPFNRVLRKNRRCGFRARWYFEDQGKQIFPRQECGDPGGQLYKHHR